MKALVSDLLNKNEFSVTMIVNMCDEYPPLDSSRIPYNYRSYCIYCTYGHLLYHALLDILKSAIGTLI